ncbi:tRNA (N6-isopentenyl adenosine(37)-C2)-methylthiotransferase MiaB [Anaplasmataceae bacterium AB001_6]|nr:tRNA (N6-isopentenyl adenosine(37)-C2)-methylthiotransferase MiaB [Anaplasmataceae bacterium AB001_6]
MKNFYIKTYGCQMNVYDSNIISKMIKSLGYQSVESIDCADVIVLNTCHIREKATEKVYSELGTIDFMAKRRNKKVTVIVAGCVAQAEGEVIKKRSKNVDIVVGPQSIHTIPVLLSNLNKKSGDTISLDFDPIAKFDSVEEYDQTHGIEKGKVSSYLSIQEGCDKFCHYCVVSYTRGAEYSREVPAIYREALNLVSSGVKEIVLLGQNVNAYSSTYDDKEYNLGLLINSLARIEGLLRIQYTTSHPSDMHEDLYLAHAYENKLINFLHLPVQSGSDRVLKTMNRRHTANYYLEVIAKLRKANPDLAFSSDFIVGYPGETNEDFEDTLKLVKEVKYASAYSFKYSPRPGTPSSEFPNQIPEELKKERLAILQSLLKEQQMEFNQSTVGRSVRVVFDKIKGDQVMGRTDYMQAFYSNDLSLYGKVAQMRISSFSQNTVSGEVIQILSENNSYTDSDNSESKIKI